MGEGVPQRDEAHHNQGCCAAKREHRYHEAHEYQGDHRGDRDSARLVPSCHARFFATSEEQQIP
jgi:hypothetical protein